MEFRWIISCPTYFLFLLSISLYLGGCQAAENVILLEGTDHTFVCNFTNMPVIWAYTNLYNDHELVAHSTSHGLYRVDDTDKYRMEAQGDGTKLTVLNVTLASSGTYQCIKFHDQRVTQDYIVEIAVAPEDMIIEQTETAEEGDLYSLSCMTYHVKPIPQITWTVTYISGETVNLTDQSSISVISNQDSTYKVISQVGIQLTRDNQDAMFSCWVQLEVSNHGVIYESRLDTYMTEAQFKPGGIEVHGWEQPTWIGGQIYTLVCIVSRSNPVPEITWYKNGVSWSPTDVQTNFFTGYYVVSSYLAINASHKEDNSTIECRASNSLMERDGDAPLILSKTLNIDYTPVMGFWINNKTVSEGDEVALDCLIEFSKPQAQVRWLHNGVAVISDASEGSNYLQFPYPDTKWATLVIQKASWEDVGEWRCEASNYVGSAVSGMIYINVRHRPVCALNTTYVAGRVDGETQLTCSILSNPNSNINVTWWSNSNVISWGQAQTISGDDYMAYHILDFTPRSVADFGPFYCTASNRFGNTPWKCTIELVSMDDFSTVKPEQIILPGVSSNTQTYIIITFCGITALLVIIIIIVVTVLRRKRRKLDPTEAHAGYVSDGQQGNIYFAKRTSMINNEAGLAEPAYARVVKEIKKELADSNTARTLASLPRNSIGGSQGAFFTPSPTNSAELGSVNSQARVSIISGVDEIYDAEAGEMIEAYISDDESNRPSLERRNDEITL